MLHLPATRSAVVAEALTWLHTPYHPQARIKGVGVDCAQLPAAVYHACGLIPDLRPVYSPQWHLHRDEELYLNWVKPYAREIDPDAAEPGDFLIWKFGRTFSHGGIALPEGRVLHAYIEVGVEIDVVHQHSELARRKRRAFSLW